MRAPRDDPSDVINDDTKPSRARRGDVLTGPERRRRWALAEKLAIVAESFEVGAVVSHVAQRHGLRPQQLFGWRRQVREQMPEGGPPAFAPVVVTDRARQPGMDAPAGEPAVVPASALIEVVLGPATIRIHGPVEARALTTVLRAVKAAT